MSKRVAVHPYAAAFPMMADDELDALAQDIKISGLQQPVVVDAAGVVLDGRNRLAACERAGVSPSFVTVEAEPVAYITSANVRRRNMTKGQTAIVAVRALLGSSNQGAVADAVGVSQQLVGRAAILVEYAPELADEVLANALTFDAAYEHAKSRRKAHRDEIVHLSTLRAEATDLAEMVGDERLPLDEAWAAYEKRTEDQRKEEDEREQGYQRRNLATAEAIHRLIWAPAEVDQFVTRVWPRHGEHVVDGMRLTPERIDGAIATLTALRERITS